MISKKTPEKGTMSFGDWVERRYFRRWRIAAILMLIFLVIPFSLGILVGYLVWGGAL